MSKEHDSKVLENELEQETILLEKELKNLKAKHIDMNASADHRTICSVLRDIYHKSEDQEIKEWCLEATIKAKKMVRKLVEYKKMHS